MKHAYCLLVVAVVCGGLTQAAAYPNCDQVNTGWCLGGDWCTKSIVWGSCIDDYRTWYCHWGGILCNWDGPTSYCYCGDGTNPNPCDCLVAGTPITLADGTTKPIESLQRGDLVLAYDESSMDPAAARAAEVLAVMTPFLAPGYFVINETFRITGSHPVLVEHGWVTVDRLEYGDALTAADGSAVPIRSLRYVDRAVMVYNLQVSSRTYVAAGVIVHNKEDCPKFTYEGP